MYSSPEGLYGIVKNNIPLYSLVMFKHHNLVELLSSNKDNFPITVAKYAKSPDIKILVRVFYTSNT